MPDIGQAQDEQRQDQYEDELATDAFQFVKLDLFHIQSILLHKAVVQFNGQSS